MPDLNATQMLLLLAAGLLNALLVSVAIRVVATDRHERFSARLSRLA